MSFDYLVEAVMGKRYPSMASQLHESFKDDDGNDDISLFVFEVEKNGLPPTTDRQLNRFYQTVTKIRNGTFLSLLQTFGLAMN
jgi:hypothetical protein